MQHTLINALKVKKGKSRDMPGHNVNLAPARGEILINKQANERTQSINNLAEVVMYN